MLTSLPESQNLEICYQLGTNAYVVKPVKFADFIEAVRNITFGHLELNQTQDLWFSEIPKSVFKMYK